MPEPLNTLVTIFQMIPQAAWYRLAKCLLSISRCLGQRIQIRKHICSVLQVS